MAQLCSFGNFIGRYLPGKIQKISVNTGNECPNRDGRLGHGGCIYCNNAAFSPGYTMRLRGVKEQIEAGKRFFARKYPEMKYLVYFQSYTSTNASDEQVRAVIEEALEQKDVAGCVVGTRPDCITESLLRWMGQTAKKWFMMVEYGAETAHDHTLRLVNRNHTWQQTTEAVTMAHRAGIPVGLHLIFGMPGEGRDEILGTVDEVNKLPVALLKCHHMQVLRGTELHRRTANGELTVPEWTLDEYAELCREVTARLRPDIMVERLLAQAPPAMVVSPRWGVKNYEFMEKMMRGNR